MLASRRFTPDYAVAPGETLKETIQEQGMTQSELAVRMGMSEKAISQIINGIAPLSIKTALKLELVLGIEASFWTRRELTYRTFLRKETKAGESPC